MSKVKIEGNASGTGTLTIAAPNTNTDRTLTLPDGAGEILTDASSLPAANLTGTLPAIDGSNLTGVSSLSTVPMFIAHGNNANQSVSANTWTKANFNYETLDSEGWYNTSTAAFTPQQAGYYLFTVKTAYQQTTSGERFIADFRVNGSVGNHRAFDAKSSWSDHYQMSGCMLIYLNGSTDYVDLYVYRSTSGYVYLNDGAQFSATLLRAA